MEIGTKSLTNLKTIKKMERFNKYQFVADLEAELLEAVASDQIESTDQVMGLDSPKYRQRRHLLY
jgi:hypothetical protein